MDRSDIAAFVRVATLGSNPEVEGKTIRCGIVLEQVVPTGLCLVGAILPHRRIVLGVVRDLDGVIGVVRNMTGDRDGADADGIIGIHRLLKGDDRLDNLLRKGQSQSSSFLAIAGLDDHGVVAVEQLHEILAGDSEAVVLVLRGGEGALDVPVHLLGNGHGIRSVLIVHGVGHGEPAGLGAEILVVGIVAGNARGGVIVYRPGRRGGVSGFGVVGVVSLDTVGHALPALGDGIGVTQSVVLEHLSPFAIANLALQNVAGHIRFGVTRSGPSNLQSGAALHFGRNRDRRRCGGCGVIDDLNLGAGAVAALLAVRVIRLHSVHDALRTVGHGVLRRGGVALINLAPTAAAVVRAFHDVPLEVAVRVGARAPRNRDGGTTGDILRDGDGRRRSRGLVRLDRPIVRDRE